MAERGRERAREDAARETRAPEERGEEEEQASADLVDLDVLERALAVEPDLAQRREAREHEERD